SFPIVITYYHSNFADNAKSQTHTFYETYNEYTENPYSETRREASPRQRPLEAGFPGSSWMVTTPEGVGTNETDYRNTIRSSYGLNAANEVKRYSVTTAFSDGIYKNSISDNGFY